MKERIRETEGVRLRLNKRAKNEQKVKAKADSTDVTLRSPKPIEFKPTKHLPPK